MGTHDLDSRPRDATQSQSLSATKSKLRDRMHTDRNAIPMDDGVVLRRDAASSVHTCCYRLFPRNSEYAGRVLILRVSMRLEHGLVGRKRATDRHQFGFGGVRRIGRRRQAAEFHQTGH
jgi:hypothetical protein